MELEQGPTCIKLPNGPFVMPTVKQHFPGSSSTTDDGRRNLLWAGCAEKLLQFSGILCKTLLSVESPETNLALNIILGNFVSIKWYFIYYSGNEDLAFCPCSLFFYMFYISYNLKLFF